jgi:uncharacterized protein (DUF2147 family)
MKTNPFKRAIAAVMLLTSTVAYSSGIDGLWHQIDDKTGNVNSLVKIETTANEARATIIQGYSLPGQRRPDDERCSRCPGSFRDRPLIGLTFMWGLKGGNREWSDGEILDPVEGKIYRAKAVLSEDEKELTVRGYLGVSLFGRSQIWRRADTGAK